MIDSRSRERFEKMLREHIQRRAPEHVQGSLIALAQQLCAGVDIEELRERDPSELYAMVFFAWQSMSERRSQQSCVSLFTPDFETHGWRSKHSVALIQCEGLPFIAESLRLELDRCELTTHQIFSSDLMIKRNQDGSLIDVQAVSDQSPEEGYAREAMFIIEFSRLTDRDSIKTLGETLEQVIADVRHVVADHKPMCSRVEQVIEEIPLRSSVISSDDQREHIDLLRWLLDDNFTFLGYGRIDVSWHGHQPSVSWVSEVALGLLSEGTDDAPNDLLAELRDDTLHDDLHENQAIFFKASTRSRVHRVAYPDYIAINLYDASGKLSVQHRFLGMFTAGVYTMEPARIPVVRRKYAEVLHRARKEISSYRMRAVERVMDVLPREELFQSHIDQLYRTVMIVHYMQERRRIRLILRTGRRRRFTTVLVYWPRDVYRTELRHRIQNLLIDALDAEEAEFTTFFSESVLVRTHFVLRLRADARGDVDVDELESLVVRISERWEDQLQRTLLDEFGEEQGAQLFNRFADAFQSGYRDDHETPAASNDIRAFLDIERTGDIRVHLYRSLEEDDSVVRFRMRMKDEAIDLSSTIPVIENLGMRVLAERPYRIADTDGNVFWVSDFSLCYALADDIDVAATAALFESAFLAVVSGEAENDPFNRLIIGARMSWREAAVFRAYAKYLRQLTYTASQFFIATTLGRHLDVTQALIELFRVRFDPAMDFDHTERRTQDELLCARILEALDSVERLNEDQVLRAYLALIRATLRTNYFQPDQTGEHKDYMSFKIACHAVPMMPKPEPEYEIFVYSPRVEGVHLRRGRVARGGLRWSDRREDFRTEVLGLVKAQQVKNAVIVPVGAKGGFVLKRVEPEASREIMQAEGVACYKTFIRALLDITDNRVGDHVQAPAHVVRHDEDDPYLVVAADKGTASFSDIANAISKEFGFWLGDAFASGGSVGYDHKGMGITARGAWVSVQRHFRERGLDTQSEPFTVVGIGDMSGDVFGNGMLLSNQIKLVAAFNHLHIFIDPDPDPALSFAERKRLFELPRSGWRDYAPELISPGGGVFDRAAKVLKLSPEIRTLLDIEAESLAPTELISAILKAPVDLIWNGGIGTYVKASSESHADAGDKSNDGLRVNADQLRAKVIGEGGNLGLTQRARVEFASAGGACNTDFIDNSAGVDCSDHEVNIKILLNQIVVNGDMTEKQRAQLLEDMTEDVARLVLRNNFRQTQALSIASYEALMRINEYRALITSLEREGGLDRGLEFLPSDEALTERRAKHLGLTRPELAVLICYVKGRVKLAILDSDIPEEPFFAKNIFNSFPALLHDRYEDEIRSHQLRREIIATQITNDMIDHMGITFIERMTQSTQAGIPEITRAYLVAREVFDLPHWWGVIENLDSRVSSSVQMDMFVEKQRLLRLASRWFVRNRRGISNPEELVNTFREPVCAIRESMQTGICGDQRRQWEESRDALLDCGVPPELAGSLAVSSMLLGALGIAEVAMTLGRPVDDIAPIAYELNERLGFFWLNRKIMALRVDSYWEAMARESNSDELDWQIRSILTTVARCAYGRDPDSECVRTDSPSQLWLERYEEQVERWMFMIGQLRASSANDYPMFSVMVRALIDLAQAGSEDEEIAG